MIIAYIFLCLFTSTVTQQNEQYCKQNCQSCDFKSIECTACSKNYQLSIGGQCIHQSTIPNCDLYGFRNICIVCKPTFRLFNNQCQRMYDGCLISGPSGLCSKCLTGAYRDRYGKCDISTLNCVRQGAKGTCELCAQGYRLSSSFKCMNNDKGCKQIENQTGLCLECKDGLSLFQYRCLNKSVIRENCEVMSADFGDCVYCKSGYYIYYGKCYSQNVLNSLIFGTQPVVKCEEQYYYSKTAKACIPEPYLCDKLDYGLLLCASCLSINILLDGICRDPSLRFCEEYSMNPNKCQTCQQNYYVSEEGLCSAYPPFCQQVSEGRCIKCISSFLLNSEGHCKDPNCENFNSVTNYCEVCRFSYFKNEEGVCLFKDLNCLQWQRNVCKKCRIDYVIDEKTQVCRFVDPDCEIFSEQDICLQCRSGYYMNKNTNLCMELPPFCLRADDIGNCELCIDKYALLTTYECVPISNISNCLVQSKDNLTYCLQCKNGYFADNGQCKQLPLLCLEYNEQRKKCKKCDDNGKLNDGYCYDNNCEVFGANAQCLGCKQNFQFGSKGECIPEITDPNCKEFQYGQCKKCSDKHYFNKFWKCVKVSTLCKEYNPNNGHCTLCYPGYLVQKGNCVRETDQNICADKKGQVCFKCITGYILKDGQCFKELSGCIKMDETFTKCTQCEKGYSLQNNFGLCIPLKTSSDVNCLVSDNDGNCLKCINRMFVNKDNGKCKEVNVNCKDYREQNGQCIKCYDGYSVDSFTHSCVLTKPKDLNCKIASPSKCQECYEGYYYQSEEGKCVVFDPLCRTTDKNNGECLSCWGGYELEKGKCILLSEKTIIEESNCKESKEQFGIILCSDCYEGFQLKEGKCIVETKDDLNCLSYNEEQEKCEKCAFGAVYDISLKKCEYPLYGEDEKCIEYRNRMCVKCEVYHVLYAFKCKALDKNCLQYDFSSFVCLSCRGNMEPKKLQCV